MARDLVTSLHFRTKCDHSEGLRISLASLRVLVVEAELEVALSTVAEV